jgi:hypothetical protein
MFRATFGVTIMERDLTWSTRRCKTRALDGYRARRCAKPEIYAGVERGGALVSEARAVTELPAGMVRWAAGLSVGVEGSLAQGAARSKHPRKSRKPDRGISVGLSRIHRL